LLEALPAHFPGCPSGEKLRLAGSWQIRSGEPDMTSKSHGRHGGNRGSAATRTDDNPTKRDAPIDIESLRSSRNEAKGGGQHPGAPGSVR
jgi:hypothetical protein